MVKQSELDMRALINILARTLTDHTDQVKQVIVKIDKSNSTVAITQGKDDWLIEIQGHNAHAMVYDIMGPPGPSGSWRIEK